MRDGEALTFDGITYRVHDLGPGGDSAVNALWVMEGGATGDGTPQSVAFVGDLVFNGTHAYMAGGYILAWLANLERFRPLLAQVTTLYPGHGEPGTVVLVDAQRDYLLSYCAAVRDISGGAASLTEHGKQQLVARMEQVRPGAPLAFMIALSADAVAAELAGHSAITHGSESLRSG